MLTLPSVLQRRCQSDSLCKYRPDAPRGHCDILKHHWESDIVVVLRVYDDLSWSVLVCAYVVPLCCSSAVHGRLRFPKCPFFAVIGYAALTEQWMLTLLPYCSSSSSSSIILQPRRVESCGSLHRCDCNEQPENGRLHGVKVTAWAGVVFCVLRKRVWVVFVVGWLRSAFGGMQRGLMGCREVSLWATAVSRSLPTQQVCEYEVFKEINVFSDLDCK